jgi:SAM-dependent methyltransferase
VAGSDKTHWDRVYAQRGDDELSWYQRHAARSLALIEACAVGKQGAIIDVGGGASGLVGDLLSNGYANLWVLDISARALDAARDRLGAAADRVHWLVADVTAAALPPQAFDVWHDRAVFHFLTDAAQRAAYVERAFASLKPRGHLIMATFAEDGPERCSGLPVARYDAAQLAAVFGDAWELLHTEKERHKTPGGGTQRFRYFHLQRADRYGHDRIGDDAPSRM